VLDDTYTCDFSAACETLYRQMALRRCFVLAISCLPSTLGKCTDNPPVVLPITDVALSSGNSIRGALMSIGNPPQNLSWIPQMYVSVPAMSLIANVRQVPQRHLGVQHIVSVLPQRQNEALVRNLSRRPLRSWHIIRLASGSRRVCRRRESKRH